MSSGVSLPDPSARRQAWLRLSRVPNLVTVPGDPIAGFLLASTAATGLWPGLLLVAIASLFFYLAGLYLNDLVDREEDQFDRPDRPLPSGTVKPRQVVAATIGCMVAGIIITCFLGRNAAIMGFMLAGAVAIYSFWSKQVPLIGPLSMGLCRGLSLLLGAMAARPEGRQPYEVWLAVLLLIAYIASVSGIARNETNREHLPVAENWSPLMVLVGFFTLLAIWPPAGWDLPEKAGFTAVYSLAVVLALRVGYRLTKQSTAQAARTDREFRDRITLSLPAQVGLLISAILFIQASLIFGSGRQAASWIIGGLIIGAWPVNRLLCRHFYAS